MLERLSRWRGLHFLLGLSFIAAAFLFFEMMRGGPLWRKAYPHLPRRIQSIPYSLRARLPGPESTPMALPSPMALETSRGPGTVDPDPDSDPTPTIAVVDPSPESLAPTPTATDATSEVDASTTAFEIPVSELPSSARVADPRHEYQSWNNCGPATISMALSSLGLPGDQNMAARFLKPDPEDKNVGPDELAEYALVQGALARDAYAGNLDLLQQLLAAGAPVVVEVWFIPEPGDEMGHYRLLTGYERNSESDALVFTAADSYHGPDVLLDSAVFDRNWRVFNRRFVAVYDESNRDRVEQVLRAHLNEGTMADLAYENALRESAELGDAFAWFNLGSALLAKDMPAEAAEAFDRSRSIGLPWRMLWYQFGPFEAYAQTGRWSDVRALAQANLSNAPNLEESHYWLGRVAEAEDDLTSARKSWETALRFNPNFKPAAEALAELDF